MKKWGILSVLLGFLILGLSAGQELPARAQILVGDYNSDGFVDIRDYAVWRANFGSFECGNPADGDGNCIVDIVDYGIWRLHFGDKRVTATPTEVVFITPVSFPTNTPKPTETNTPKPTETNTPTNTPTATGTPTVTSTVTITPTRTHTPRPPTWTPCPAPNPHC